MSKSKMVARSYKSTRGRGRSSSPWLCPVFAGRWCGGCCSQCLPESSLAAC